jgi:hypothetical protein
MERVKSAVPVPNFLIHDNLQYMGGNPGGRLSREFHQLGGPQTWAPALPPHCSLNKKKRKGTVVGAPLKSLCKINYPINKRHTGHVLTK